MRGTSNGADFASSTNFDDFTFAASGGGGLWITLHAGPRPIRLDLGARYLNNGRVKYLREGSIHEAPDGSISFKPIESESNLVLYHLGVSVGLF